MGLFLTQYFSSRRLTSVIAQMWNFSHLGRLHFLYLLQIIFHICSLTSIPRPSFSALHIWVPAMASLMNSDFFPIQSISHRSARLNCLCTTGNLHSKACKGFCFFLNRSSQGTQNQILCMVLITSLSLEFGTILSPAFQSSCLLSLWDGPSDYGYFTLILLK